MGEYYSLVPTLKDIGIKYQAGLGIFPAGGPPVGGWSSTPGPGFFGKQSMQSLLPRLTGKGSTPSDNLRLFGVRRYGKRAFGYPLMNKPSADLNETMFPRYPVGSGNTPGGDGGIFLQGLPSFQQYWGFGRKRSRSRRTSRKRTSRKKYDPKQHLINAIKSRDRKELMISLDNFDHSRGFNGYNHPLYKKGLKIFESLRDGGKKVSKRRSRRLLKGLNRRLSKRSHKSRKSHKSRRRSRRSRRNRR